MKSIHYFLKHLENLALPHYLAKGQTKSHCARSVCMSHPQAEIESNNYATSLGLRHEEETVQTNLATDPKLSTLRNLRILQPWFCDRLAKSKTIVNFGKTLYQDTMHALTPTEYCFLCRKKQIILSQTNFSKKDRCQRRFQADFTPPASEPTCSAHVQSFVGMHVSFACKTVRSWVFKAFHRGKRQTVKLVQEHRKRGRVVQARHSRHVAENQAAQTTLKL